MERGADRELWLDPSSFSSDKLRWTWQNTIALVYYKPNVKNRLIISLLRWHKTSWLKKLPMHRWEEDTVYSIFKNRKCLWLYFLNLVAFWLDFWLNSVVWLLAKPKESCVLWRTLVLSYPTPFSWDTNHHGAAVLFYCYPDNLFSQLTLHNTSSPLWLESLQPAEAAYFEMRTFGLLATNINQNQLLTQMRG